MSDKPQKKATITRQLPLLALGATLLLSGCSAPAQDPGAGDDKDPVAQDSRLTTISDSGTLKVCTTGDYRPFTYLDPKSVNGQVSTSRWPRILPSRLAPNPSSFRPRGKI
ncbi:hypothetical protein ACFO7V_14960 [Glutamicibacter bergerei]|uniref:Uncharacterized protein n=1 Tax=Glutamicibacter bergerei TaxID=256702 RepID=A0ABV9MN46_9MICC